MSDGQSPNVFMCSYIHRKGRARPLGKILIHAVRVATCRPLDYTCFFFSLFLFLVSHSRIKTNVRIEKMTGEVHKCCQKFMGGKLPKNPILLKCSCSFCSAQKRDVRRLFILFGCSSTGLPRVHTTNSPT